MPLLTLPSLDARGPRAKALVFEDPTSQALLERIAQIAPTDATVLVSGETGTGKEIVARHLHELSARRDQPFVALNCGAISESLVEAELFGYERGAFTGAATATAGWFEAARGGTLFLDELGELPLALQVKLLRVLQEREVVRLGSRRPIPIDVRLIAATNASLPDLVARGRFRADLYYRVNVASIHLPPLRERPGDILPLARYFIDLHRGGRSRLPPVLASRAAAMLVAHPWPGNIRELENVVHRALVVCSGERIRAEDLQLGETALPAGAPAPAQSAGALEAALLALFEHPPADLHAHIEETVIRTAYRYCDGNQLQTARLLGISRNIVRARLMQIGELATAPRRGRRRRAIRVGYQAFGLLSLVKARGAFDRAARGHDWEVDWSQFASGIELLDALQAGAVDLGVVGEGPPVLAQSGGAPLVYLAVEPPAPRDEAIVVHEDSGIRAVADLEGMRVAVSPGANVSYLLIRALDEVGLGYGDVEIFALPPAGARAAFARREIDAWAIWNPFLAWVAAEGKARVLRDATGLASNRAYYVGARAFVARHPEIVELFLDDVRATGSWANEDRARVADLMAPTLDVPRTVLAAALAGARFGAQPIDVEVLHAQQRVADTFHRVGLIARAVRVAEACWTPPPDEAAPPTRAAAAGW